MNILLCTWRILFSDRFLRTKTIHINGDDWHKQKLLLFIIIYWSYSSYNLMAPSNAFASTLLITFLFISNFWRWGRRPNNPSDLILPISLSFKILRIQKQCLNKSQKYQINIIANYRLTIRWYKLVCLLVFQLAIFRNSRRLYHRMNNSTDTERPKNSRLVLTSYRLDLLPK